MLVPTAPPPFLAPQIYKKQSGTLFLRFRGRRASQKTHARFGKKKKKSINGLLFTRLPKNSAIKTKAQLFPHNKGRIDSAPKNKLA